jgi:hypothetical protein
MIATPAAAEPAAPEPTMAERARPPLVAELERLRHLLEAYRDGTLGAAVPSTPSEGTADRLGRLLGLSPFERDVLLLAAGVELDGYLAALVASLQGGAESRPTFGLALGALPGAHWDALAPRSPLRYWRLVDAAAGHGAALASRPLGIDERLLHHLTGIDSPDERLEGVVRLGVSPAPIAPSQQRLAKELAAAAVTAGPPALIRIDGDDLDALRGVAHGVAAALGRRAVVIRASALPPAAPDLARLLRLIDRELLLVGGLPLVEVGGAADAVVGAFLEDLLAPLAVVVGESGARPAGRTELHGSVELPAAREARGLWSEALGEQAAAAALEPVIEEIAQLFRLSAAAVQAIALELGAHEGTEAADAQLRRLCRERARVPLEGLAERIEPVARWEDLVLPAGHHQLLQDIVRHVRHRTQVYERWGFGARTARGLGVTALFSGESGTGKTLAAEVLAGELGLDLYRIDLSATVSKYIGETEKNLRRLFDAAEASGAVLLFDEADALFGKRGEVKDGHDRYANLEVAYLLQRMESYRGLAILTTNLRSNVDRAFLRRLRFVVQFPFPDAEQRAQIWRRTLPPALPLDGISPEGLARLNVSGGSIRSIALAAAFMAAEDRAPMAPAHVLRAARIEYAKAERALTDTETEALR